LRGSSKGEKFFLFLKKILWPEKGGGIQFIIASTLLIFFLLTGIKRATKQEITFSEFVARGEEGELTFSGRLQKITLLRKSNTEEKIFWLRDRGELIPLRGLQGVNLPRGAILSGRGKVKKDPLFSRGYLLQVQQWHYHRLYPLKVYLSFIALAAAFSFFYLQRQNWLDLIIPTAERN